MQIQQIDVDKESILANSSDFPYQFMAFVIPGW